jgi:hypothetical protein
MYYKNYCCLVGVLVVVIVLLFWTDNKGTITPTNKLISTVKTVSQLLAIGIAGTCPGGLVSGEHH